MRRFKRVFATQVLAGLVAISLLGGGCVPFLLSQGVPAEIVFILYVIGAIDKTKGTPAKAPKIKGSLDVMVTGSIGGLSGTYDLTFGSFGTFTGSGTIGGNQKSVKVTAENTNELKNLVKALVLAEHGLDITVGTAKATTTGKQTTGGVKKSWKTTITFTGTINAGPDAGRGIKGTLKSKGSI